MAASGIAGSGLFGYGNLLSEAQKLQLDFQQLGKDLQSGNLSAAQSDLSSFTQDAAVFSPSSGTQRNNSPVGKEFQQLTQDLQSGNLSAAQQDYASIVQALQGSSTPGSSAATNVLPGASGTQTGGVQSATKDQDGDANGQATQGGGHDHGRRHSHDAEGGSGAGGFAQFMSQLGQALQSGNLSAAQQAYSTFSHDLAQNGSSPVSGQNGGQPTSPTSPQGGAGGGSGASAGADITFAFISISVTA